MIPAPRIRPATAWDAPALAGLFWRIRQECVPAIPMIVHPRDTVEPFVRGLIQEAQVLVAEKESEELIGFLATSAPDHLDHLYIAAEHTGGGLGSRFVELAKERHPGGLQLWAFQANTAAIRFYERHGFRQTRWTDGDNDEGAPDVLMVWSPGREARETWVSGTGPAG